MSAGGAELELEREVLNCLVDSDESPWIVHTQIRTHVDPNISIDAVLQSVETLELRGFVEQRIPEANFAEALDEYRRHAESPRWRSRALCQEYGPWYAITEAGRAEWHRRST